MIQVTDIATSIREERELIFSQLAQLVSFQSVHSDPACAADLAAAADWVTKTLEEAGLQVNQQQTIDGSVTILGNRAGKADAPTVLLYSHYDTVPTGNLDSWDSPPLILTERAGRWYGRGTADCKGNLIMHLAALRAVDRLGGTDANITMVVEGSEESGGLGLTHLIRTQPELFAADVIMIADAGNIAVGQPSLTVALRGNARITVRVTTLKAPIHSGMYGGSAPDAVMALMSALTSLHDEYGRMQISGIDTSMNWAGTDYDREAFIADAQLIDGAEVVGKQGEQIADALWARPSFAVTGFSSTPVEAAFNVIAPTAEAVLDVRVPPSLDPQEVAEAVSAHIQAAVPWGAAVDIRIDDVNRGILVDPNELLADCLSQAYGRPVSTIGMGATIPLTVELQDAYPKAEIAIFGIEEPKCTIHSANESVDPTEIENIAAAEALFLLRARNVSTDHRHSATVDSDRRRS